MTTGPQMTVKCPNCSKPMPMLKLAPVRTTRCPNCGREWRVRLQDVPGGRFLIDLEAPRG